MKVNINVPKDTIEGLNGIFSWQFAEQAKIIFPYLFEKFSTPEELSEDLKPKVQEIIENRANYLGIDSRINIDLVFYSNNDVLTEARYFNEKSSRLEGFFDMNMKSVMDFFYSENNGTSLYGLPVNKSMEHELRHHLDHDACSEKSGVKTYDKTRISLDLYVYGQLRGNRIEGFGEFFREYNSNTFLPKLKNNTSSVKEFLDYISQNNPFDTTSNWWTHKALFFKNNGINPETNERLPFWTGISPYTQGEYFMRVIALAEQGSIAEIPEETYRKVLKDVIDMNLKQFYTTFYKGLDSLGLNEDYEIFPKELVMKSLAKYSNAE
ncbi:MAG: hypothetical protein KKF89_00020 [Nanoarchaeota archaeon]|nr:hypothetical protein [Nanoarchaeota archaeon]MBU1854081.1 hypothetical protein [Nanoarchaeota archaeon]